MEVLIMYFFIFLFVFSIISLIQLIFRFIGALLSNPPKPFFLNKISSFFYGIITSYLITFLIYLIS